MTSGATPDSRSRISACIEHLGHILPGQASIKDFVHHNTLHGFQHLPFPDALAAAHRLTGIDPWLPEAHCRELYREGRIDDRDLSAGMEQVARQAGIDTTAQLVAAGQRSITRGEVMRLGLIHDLSPLPLARFLWQTEEMQALSATAETAARWAACLEILNIDAGFIHPESMVELSALEERSPSAVATGRESFAEQALALWDELRQKVGVEGTLRELLRALTGEDALDHVRAALLRHLGAHLDLGLAAWHNPDRPQGLYRAWKNSARHDLAWNLDGFGPVSAAITALPDDAVDTILLELGRLGIPEERWPSYLERLALELPGWSGMIHWRQGHPGYAGTADVPVAMADYLAVRLVLERLACGTIARRCWNIDATLPALGQYFRNRPEELWVRHAYHSGDLPEFLLDLVEPHLVRGNGAGLPEDPALWSWLAERIEAWRATPSAEQSARHGPARSAWPLFRLAGLLDLSPGDIRLIGRSGAESLLGALRRLDRHQRGFLWLLAYEHHYREQILAGLAANHGRWTGHAKGPSAQVVFCMDDREEGIRRHLEEIAPSVETLGGAAHFAVFQNHYALDDSTPTPLCPVIPEVIVPSHNVREVPKPGADGTANRHRARLGLRLRWRERLHQWSRLHPPAATFIALLAGPFMLASLLWRSLSPGSHGSVLSAWRERFDIEVETELSHQARRSPDGSISPASPQSPREGFTDIEGAERIGGFLTALGLTGNFAPLVVIMGHGSNSTNNPHMAAYDCGACAGRHSGPNARLFAALANRPDVRRELAARGITVPDGTWFVGAEHNTADDRVTWYDRRDLPANLAAPFARLDGELAESARAHARERCRRLFSAPLGISPAAALAHVWGRRNDWSQARPELGHATNACAFIGRRAMSRGAFFDRRAFLISYDPQQDPEGKVLERHLLINGAVGAGISLEYFFSTVNNDEFGCGSKITHNVAGYFGVMQGAASDLATGLPRQMIEVHEAMRLLVVVEQTLEIITEVYQRQPPLQELVGKGWVSVAAKDPATGAIHLFDPQSGWHAWQPTRPVPTVPQSADWFDGHRGPLPPALLERPLLQEAMA